MSSKALAWVAADTLNSPHPTCISSLAYMSQSDLALGREYVPLYATPVAAAQTVDLEQFRRVAEYAKYWADEKGNDEVGAAADRLLALIDAQKEARNG